jgi:hypothetical protein
MGRVASSPALFPTLKNLHFPAKSSMQIALERKAKTVKRFQYQVTAAYCFTDYPSLGAKRFHALSSVLCLPQHPHVVYARLLPTQAALI